jgi:hypothetical protein
MFFLRLQALDKSSFAASVYVSTGMVPVYFPLVRSHICHLLKVRRKCKSRVSRYIETTNLQPVGTTYLLLRHFASQLITRKKACLQN